MNGLLDSGTKGLYYRSMAKPIAYSASGSGTMTIIRDPMDSQSSVSRPKGLADQVYELLSMRIIAGDFRPGEPIVIEHLATQLDVSPTPVREALARFMHEGIVTKSPTGRLQLISLTKDYVLDSYFVRAALEGLAAELATKRMVEEEVAELRQYIVSMGAFLAHGQQKDYAALNSKFHGAIVEGARNAILLKEFPLLELHTKFILHFTKVWAKDYADELHHEHMKIMAAIESRDEKQARRAMEQHIRSSGVRSLRVLGLDESDQ